MTEEKFILDATAGYRMMWFNKHHPNCFYIDQRPECEPDQVADFRDLSFIPSESKRLIVFDPPHLLRVSDSNGGNILTQFGCLRPDSWKSDLEKGFKELWRILQPYGILIFKWNNQALSSDQVIALAPVKPLFYQISHSGTKLKDKNKRVKTLWFCFMKIPNSVKNQVSEETTK